MLSTGVDIPSIDTVIMCTPLTKSLDLEQTIGRALRKHEDKKPVVIIDLYDLSFQERTSRWFKIRSDFYNQANFNFNS